MEYQTAAQAAARLGVTVRAVQKWAKENKLPGARKSGRDWMIPADALPPGKTAPEEANHRSFDPGKPFPLFSADYEPGRCLEFIESIADPDERELAMSEYYYFTGEFDKVSALAEPYMDSAIPSHRLSAAVFCLFSNMVCRHVHMTHFSEDAVVEELKREFTAPTDERQLAMAVFSAQVIKTQLHIPVEGAPSMDEYIRFLPDGHKLNACYLMAYDAYLKGDYSRCLGCAHASLVCCPGDFPIPKIYLYIIIAIAQVNLMQVEEAKKTIDLAWEIAHRDGIFVPFVEHYSLLQGLIEVHFKKNHPATYQKIINAVKNYNTGWYRLYNEKNDRTLATNLTPAEFTVAMLYSRNWRAKEIAAHMEISERTVSNYIQNIYEKLHISARKELREYLLS